MTAFSLAVVFVFTGFIGVSYGFGIYLFASLAPAMRGDLGFSYGDMGVITSLAQISFLGFALLSGFLTARMNSVSLMLSAIGTCVLALWVVSVASAVWVMAAMLIALAGTASAVWTPMVEATQRFIPPQHHGRALGLMSSGTAYGVFINGLIIQFFLDDYGWRFIWLASFILTACLWVGAWVLFYRARRRAQTGTRQEAHQEARSGLRAVENSVAPRPLVRAHATAPPSVRAHATAPPSVCAHATAPPSVRAHATAPPSVRAHATAPPSVRAHAAAPSSVRAHAAAPSLDAPRRLAVLVIISMFFHGFACVPFQNYFSSFLVAEYGYRVVETATAWKIIGVVGMFSGFLMGWLGDRITIRWSLMISLILLLISTLMLIVGLAQGYWIWLIAICFGMAFYPIFGLVPAFIARNFSGARASRIFGLGNVGLGVGAALGNVVGGALKASTGSFVSSYTLFLAAALVGCVLCLYLNDIKTDGTIAA